MVLERGEHSGGVRDKHICGYWGEFSPFLVRETLYIRVQSLHCSAKSISRNVMIK